MYIYIYRHMVSCMLIIIVFIIIFSWLLECQCEGSRNFLSTLRIAVENDEESKHNIGEWRKTLCV